MSTTILATKLYIPHVRPWLVARERLTERLNAGMNCRLTLVSTSTVFGKTTLVSLAALRAGGLPKSLNILGLLFDTMGIISIFLGLTGLTGIFGLSHRVKTR